MCLCIPNSCQRIMLENYRWMLHESTVNVLKFWTLVTCQNSLAKQRRPISDCFWRSSLIRAFPVCYSDIHFVNSSPENQHFIWELKDKSVRIYRKFTVCVTSKKVVMLYIRLKEMQIKSTQNQKQLFEGPETQLFQKVVFLHIKLKGMKIRSSCKQKGSRYTHPIGWGPKGT